MPRTSSDKRIESVRFGETTYANPQQYLVGVTQPRDDNPYAAFTIYVLLPDLSPRTPKNAADLDRTGWHDQLRALFQYGKYPRPNEEILKFYLGVSKQPDSDFQVVGGKYKLYKRPNNVPHEIYAKDTSNGLFLFTCEREDDFGQPPISPHCTVMENLGSGIGVTYSFGRTHLLDAADIDLKLRALMESFVSK